MFLSLNFINQLWILFQFLSYFKKDDQRVCLNNGIITRDMKMICPVDASGRFTEEVRDFKGQYIKVSSWLPKNLHCIFNYAIVLRGCMHIKVITCPALSLYAMLLNVQILKFLFYLELKVMTMLYISSKLSLLPHTV